VFLKREDYQCFIDLLSDGLRRFAVDLYGYSAMPTHFHLVLGQRESGAVSAYLHRVTSLLAANYRSETLSSGLGHVFQRRYWSEALRDERHFLAVLRYVEANARRASLVERAEDWEWGSLWERLHSSRRLVSTALVSLPPDWCELVNIPLAQDVLESLRHPTPRGRPATHRRADERAGHGMPAVGRRTMPSPRIRSNDKGAWPLFMTR